MKHRILGVAILLPSLALAADWPNYRGPNHNGVADETGWSGKEPKVAWTVPLGPGASSVTVVKDRLYTMGNQNNRDIVYCLDTATGREIWRHAYDCPVAKRSFEGGPASTPTVDGERVYTLSYQGHLFCLEAATGKVVWSRHLVRDFKGVPPQWGFAGSPLVEGDLLILDTGGDGTSTIALNKADGALRWKSGDEVAGYATPVPATWDGKRALVLFKGRELLALEAATGNALWRLPWRTSYDVNAATPIVRGDQVFVSTGYETGAALWQTAAREPRELWRNKNLCSMVNSPLLIGGHIYGFSGNVNQKSSLNCIKWATGELIWSKPELGNGSLTAADGKLVVLTANGELVIGLASPSGFEPHARLPVLKGRCWVAPVISGGRVFCRSNAGTLVAVDVR